MVLRLACWDGEECRKATGFFLGKFLAWLWKRHWRALALWLLWSPEEGLSDIGRAVVAARTGWGLTGWWARVGVGDGHLWSQHLDGGRNIVKSTLATQGDLVSGCVLVLESSRCGSLWSQIKWLKHNFNYSCPWFGICTNTNLSFQCMHYNKIGFANQFALTFKKNT